MKRKKWMSILLILACLLLCLPAAATEPALAEEPAEAEAAAEAPAETPAEPAKPTEFTEGFSVKQYAEALSIFRTVPRAALLIETQSDTTLYALNIHEKNYPASLTKLMTVLLALENGNLSDVLTISATALEGLHESGSTAGLMEGEQLTLEELLYCTMVSSANEACNVIAEYISGSVDAFVELMNTRAQELGCLGTHFVNPHGLHDEEHYTTAYDVSLIAREALKYETFRTICNTSSHTVPATNLSGPRELNTTNELIQDATAGGYRYSRAAGVKTGFTTPAQCCLVSTADDDNIQLFLVILGAERMMDENGNWVSRSFPEAINLFEYGFNTFQESTVMSTLYPVAEVTVNQSAGAQTVALAPAQEVRTLIYESYDPKEIVLDVDIPNPVVDAPVEAGQILGSVTVKYKDMILGRSELAAITSISRSEITYQADTTKAYVENNWWKWMVGILLAMVVLLVAYVVLMRVHYRQMRKKKLAARRRALEQQRRRRNIHDGWYDSE